MNGLTRGCVPLALLLISASAFADMAPDFDPPKPKKDEPKALQLVIEVQDNLKVSRLQIPKNQLPAMQAFLSGEKKGASLPARTLVAGIAMAFALSFGGLWVARRGVSLSRAGGTGLLVAAGVSALLMYSGEPALADRAMPGTPARTWVANQKNALVVEVVEEGDAVKLLVNRHQLQLLLLEDEKALNEKGR